MVGYACCFFYLKEIKLRNNFTESGDATAALVLTALMTILTRLPHFMKQSILVENSMISVERIVEYGNLKQEAYLEDVCGQSSVEHKGSLKFEHVWLRYAEGEEYVLKDISFMIREEEKVNYQNISLRWSASSSSINMLQIGVIGRTGAGKSSLITALFRLAEPEGSILFNGQDILKLPLQEIRNNISIIPQDPTLFACTLRENLDPFGQYSDQDIWSAIEQV